MRIRFILLFLCVCSQLFSQIVDFDKGSIAQKKYFEAISFQLVNDKIIVPVIINGKNYKFLLDTGAPNVISNRIQKELNLMQVDSTLIKDGNNLHQSMKFAEVPSLKLGSLNFENQIALIYDFENHNLLSCFGIDGIIGSNLLKNSSLKISLTNRKIYITDNVKNLNPNNKSVKITLAGSQKAPYVAFEFVGKNKTKGSDLVLIDTGMDGFYHMSNRAFTIFDENKIVETVAESTGLSNLTLFGTGKPALQRLLKVENASLSNISIKNLVIETTDDGNSRIGLKFLEYGDMIIDFKNKKFYFEALENITLENKIPKYAPTMIDNKFVVGMVWDDLLKKQMSFGDAIMSVDSQNVNEMTPCEILSAKKGWREKTNYTMEIKTKDNLIIPIKIQN